MKIWIFFLFPWMYQPPSKKMAMSEDWEIEYADRPHITEELWPMISAAINPEWSRLGQWLLASLFFAPSQNQPEKAKCFPNESCKMPFLVSLPPATPCQPPLITAYLEPLHTFSFSIKLSHFSASLLSLCQKQAKVVVSCYSKFRINSFCLFSFGWSLFLQSYRLKIIFYHNTSFTSFNDCLERPESSSVSFLFLKIISYNSSFCFPLMKSSKPLGYS